MPLASSHEQPMRTRPAFSQAKIQMLIDYVASFGGPAIPTVTPRQGSLSKGQSLFALNCAGCHTIQGSGGIVTGAVVPSLNVATPRQIAEAIRIGPYVMPRFGAGELSNADIDSIARYVQSTQSPDDRGGWGIGRIGPIPEGMVAWLLAAAALLLIARLIGERTPAQSRKPTSDRGGRVSERENDRGLLHRLGQALVMLTLWRVGALRRRGGRGEPEAGGPVAAHDGRARVGRTPRPRAAGADGARGPRLRRPVRARSEYAAAGVVPRRRARAARSRADPRRPPAGGAGDEGRGSPAPRRPRGGGRGRGAGRAKASMGSPAAG